MMRTLLPVLLCVGAPSLAEGLKLPGLGEQTPPAPMCENIPGSQQNCVRILACIGADGLFFDGSARGWDAGIVTGRTSEGLTCTGHWRAGGFLGSGTAQVQCEDGLEIAALYYSQDSETGTAIGRGTDSLGRAVIAWSGENVLTYLTPDGRPNAELPCGPTPIPIS